MNQIEFNHNLIECRVIGKNLYNDMMISLTNYRKKEGASTFVIEKTEKQISLLVNALDGFDDLVLSLLNQIQVVSSDSYKRGFDKGLIQGKTGLKKPSKLDKELYRAYTISIDRQRTEGEEIPPHISEIINTWHL